MRIIISQNGRIHQSIDFNAEKITLGRSSDCDFMICSQQLSRQHVEISQKGRNVYIRDLGSTNGTWLGTQQIAPHTPIEWTADRLAMIGDYTLRLELALEFDATVPMARSNLEDTAVHQPIVPARYNKPPPRTTPVSTRRPPPAYPQGMYRGSPATAMPVRAPHQAKKAKSSGMLAFLGAFASVSGVFKNIAFTFYLLRSPVARTMEVVERHELAEQGKRIPASPQHQFSDIDPYKYLATGLSIHLVLSTSVGFLLPKELYEYGELVTSFIFVVILLINFISSYCVFKIATKSNKSLKSYMVMGSIFAGVELTLFPLLALLYASTSILPPLSIILILLCFYIYIYYNFGLEKVFWNISYVKVAILSIIAWAIPSLVIGVFYGVVAGFTMYSSAPPPMIFDIHSGGNISAPQIFGPSCVGYIRYYEPYWYDVEQSGLSSLQFAATTSTDATLVVMTPTGLIFCDDNSYELDPIIEIPAPVIGRYQIWIGNFTRYLEPGKLVVIEVP